MQQQSLVHETMTINPRNYFVKRPRDAKKAPSHVGAKYKSELVNLLIRAKFSFNSL